MTKNPDPDKIAYNRKTVDCEIQVMMSRFLYIPASPMQVHSPMKYQLVAIN